MADLRALAAGILQLALAYPWQTFLLLLELLILYSKFIYPKEIR